MRLVILAFLLSGCVTVEDWRPRIERENGHIEVDIDSDEIVVWRVWEL